MSLATVGGRDDFERKSFAAQQADLAVAHQIDRRLRTNAGDGTGCDESPPNFAPLRIGYADRLHELSSSRGPEEVVEVKCNLGN